MATYDKETELNRLLELVKAAFNEGALVIDGPSDANEPLSTFNLGIRDDLNDNVRARIRALCEHMPK